MLRATRIRSLTLVLALMLATAACGPAKVVPTPSPTPRPTSTLRMGWEPRPTNTTRPAQTTTTPPTPTPPPEPLRVARQGFGQNGRELGYSFLVHNANPGLTFERTQYQMAAYDKAGVVVKTDSGYINLLLPGQTLGVGGTGYLDKGVVVDEIEVTLLAGSATPGESVSNLSVGPVALFPGQNSSATAVVTSRYNRDVTDVLVSVVPYDRSGQIIGGGFTYLEFVLANSSTGVSAFVTFYGEVARVELYPSLSGLSILTYGDESPVGARAPLVDKYGFGQDGRAVGFGLVVTNPNLGWAIESSRYHITAYDREGLVIGVDEGRAGLLLPGQTLGIGGVFYVPEGSQVERLDAQLLPGSHEEWARSGIFTTDRVTFAAGDWSSRVTGWVASSHSNNLKTVPVSAITFDPTGAVNGGGRAYVDFVPAGGRAAVEVTVTVAGEVARAEMYPSVADLGDLQ